MRRRCGIAGFGTIGRLYYRLAETAGLDIAAIADPNPHNVEGSAAAYRDHRQMLASGIDTVLIATPPASHFEIARDALSAGADVLLEKPPTTTSEQSEELIALSHTTGRVLFFAFHARYNRAVTLAREALGGASVREAHVIYKEDVSRYHEPGSWVLREGVVRDSGINAISLLTVFIEEELRVTRADYFIPPGSEAETRATLDIEFGAAGSARVELDWHHHGPEVRDIILRSDAGEHTIDIVSDRLYSGAPGPRSSSPAIDMLAREYQSMLAHFADALGTRRSFHSTRELRLVEEAERASGRKIGKTPASHPPQTGCSPRERPH